MRARFPVLTSALLVVCVVSWVGCLIQKGLLTTKDEYITAERAREMLLLGRGAVWDNFEFDVVKPPLQYWLTTLTLPRFEKREVAVRIWPLLFGALTAVAVAWLAFLIEPNRPWLMPLSVALLLTCALFLTEICRGTLDAGLTFFTTLAIVFSQLARRQAIWWLAVALACSLGALQKTPLIALIWLIIIVVRSCSKAERPALRRPWLAVSISMAVAAMAVWPMIQMFQYHQTLADVLRIDEALLLMGPSRLGAKPFFEIPFRLTTTWPCGVFALFAAAAVYFGAKKDSRPGVVEISIVSLAVIVLAMLFNFRSIRYVLPIIPCLCVLLALFLLRLWEERRRVAKIVLICVAVGALVGPEITRRIVDARRKDYSAQKLIAEKLGSLQEEGTQIVILETEKVLWEQFYLFYGNLRSHAARWSTAEMRKAHPSGRAIGVCNVQDFSVVRENYRDVTIEMTQGQFICWRTSAR